MELEILGEICPMGVSDTLEYQIQKEIISDQVTDLYQRPSF